MKQCGFQKDLKLPEILMRKSENYYAVYNSAAFGRCLLIFTPNEQILQGMKKHLNKDIVLKLFYNRNAG